MNHSVTVGKLLLMDVNPDIRMHHAVRIVNEGVGLGLAVEVNGYGTKEDPDAAPIVIEIKDGELRVLLWDDISSEEPHIISLGDARVLPKPQKGDFIRLDAEQHTVVDEMLEEVKPGEFEVLDDGGEGYNIKRNEPDDNDLRRGWIVV